MPHTYVILYLFVTGIFERSLEEIFSFMEEIKQKQQVMDHKLDTLLQEREDGAGADASGRRKACLLYTSPSPRDEESSRMPSSA